MSFINRPLRLRREHRTLYREVSNAWLAGIIAVRRALKRGDVVEARALAKSLRAMLSTFCEEPR